ncbi:MAG TPA: DUF488 domain-containing protein [bacterium]|nr:DUF488 domain-containing protein [bacterium]
MAAGPPRVVTVGHSTRSLEEFLALLREAGVTVLVDVRIAPGSRRHPHFCQDALAAALAAVGIRYEHEPDLGGRRRIRPDSPHVGWRTPGFRAYADHMDSESFRRALDRVIALARTGTVALMCAEALPWRCHRQLIADALLARGVPVMHLLGPGERRPHALPPFARVEGDRLVYDRVGDLFPVRGARSEGAAGPESQGRGRR